MKKIIINSPKYGRHEVLVDDEDYELASKYRWSLSKTDGKTYACTAIGGRKNKKAFSMHRLLLDFPKGKCIDHHDGNGLNNQRNNIRIATDSQNQFNSDKPKTNSSGYKGVSWRRDKQKFQVQIKFNKNHIHAGYFDNVIEAAKKYNELALRHHGEFARLNQIPI